MGMHGLETLPGFFFLIGQFQICHFHFSGTVKFVSEYFAHFAEFGQRLPARLHLARAAHPMTFALSTHAGFNDLNSRLSIMILFDDFYLPVLTVRG